MSHVNPKTIKNLTDVIVGLVALIISLTLMVFYTLTYGKPQEQEVAAWCGTKEFVCGTPDYSQTFKINCASCHALHKRIIGPSLAGVLERVPSEQWLETYITNEEKLRKANGDYIKQLNNEMDAAEMSHQFDHLSREEIEELMNYFKQ